MNYYITHERESVNNAGSKAPADINYICEKMGWSAYEIRTISRKENRVLRYFNVITSIHKWAKLTRIASGKEVVLYQHPMYSGTQIATPYLFKLKKNGVVTIVLIHDIEHLRSINLNDDFENKEIQFIDSFEKIIVHNQKMRDYLAEKGIGEEKLVCLNLFDYITDCNINNHNISDNLSVVIAGNLDPIKCSYVYEFAKMNPEISVNLYGGNFDSKTRLPNVSYKGSFKPDELPSVLEAKFGLVWDGDDLESCSGVMGNYLKYNNPHKLSLYIAAGIPVIVWKESAVSDFVIENNCGVVVESLIGLKKRLESISSNEYSQMKNKCIKLSEDLRSGTFFKNALRFCGVKEMTDERIEK